MSTTRPPRIFIGPIEVAGYYTRLAANLREIGVDAVAVDLSGHPFRYERGPRPFVWIRFAEALGRLDARVRGWPTFARVPIRSIAIVGRIPLFLWALGRFDVFVFGFAQTFFYTWELPLLRRLGKRLIFVFNGSDARPPYIDGALMRPSLHRTPADCIAMTRRQKSRIRRIERFADAIVAQPAFSHFFEKPVVDFFRVGLPWIEPPPNNAAHHEDQTVRILHSPSEPEVKGSARIREVVESLVDEGHDLELVELRGLPNDVVRREMARCAFVIDQIYSDAPMVGFATEAAVAGKAAIVGGYVWPTLNCIYQDDAMPPVAQCRPDDLRTAILRLAEDPGARDDLGRKAEAFVRTNWAREDIARRYLSLINGRVEPALVYDPSTLDYVRGVGLDEEAARGLVRQVISLGGTEALQLEDKPALRDAFISFANEEGN